MAAPKKNNYNTKWKTAKERQDACKRFCDHLKQGLSFDCWAEADFDTIKRYIKDFPEDFHPDLINLAKREAKTFWEKVGIDGTIGKIKGFNAKSWEFNLKNRYGWRDKYDADITSGGEKIAINLVMYSDRDAKKFKK